MFGSRIRRSASGRVTESRSRLDRELRTGISIGCCCNPSEHARTPTPWTDAENGGFTTGDSWLDPTGGDDGVSVASERDGDESVLDAYRALVALRRGHDALVYGDYELLLPDDEQFYCYTRTLGSDHIMVVLNWSAQPATFEPPAVEYTGPTLLYGNYEDPPSDPTESVFRPYESAVYRL